MCRWQLNMQFWRRAGFAPPTREEADAIWEEHQRECDLCPFTKKFWRNVLIQLIVVVPFLVWAILSGQ